METKQAITPVAESAMAGPTHDSMILRPGDIVWCSFPWDNRDTRYPRPCLVLAQVDVRDDKNRLKAIKYKMVYGTTGKTDRLYPGELLLEKSATAVFIESGLGGTTKFCFGKIVDMDYTEVNFPKSPRAGKASGDGRPVGETCLMGRLHESLLQPAMRALNDYTEYARKMDARKDPSRDRAIQPSTTRSPVRPH